MSFTIEDKVKVEFAFRNNGALADGSTLKLTDTLNTAGASMLLPQVMTNIVREAVEPLLVGASLLQRINYKAGLQLTFPAVGAMRADDIAEGQEYPEQQLQMGGATAVATIGKSGLAFKITEEMIRYSQYDVIGMHLQAAGRSLARHKEEKIFKHIRASGVTVFDNVTPANSLNGVTTGRDLAGNANGSVTADDIFDTFAQISTQGFPANTILVHPLTWVMFVKDPTMRAFALANGAGSFFGQHTGSATGGNPWAASSLGGMGPSGGQSIIPGQTSNGGVSPSGQTPSLLTAYNQTINSAPVLPGYLNIPFRVVVSPFVPYDARRKLTDIYMFDSNELGALVVDEDVTVEEFNDPRVDIRKVKLRERYGLAILNEGLAIGVMRNVHVVPNQVVTPAQSVINDLSVIAPTADVL